MEAIDRGPNETGIGRRHPFGEQSPQALIGVERVGILVFLDLELPATETPDTLHVRGRTVRAAVLAHTTGQINGRFLVQLDVHDQPLLVEPEVLESQADVASRPAGCPVTTDDPT